MNLWLFAFGALACAVARWVFAGRQLDATALLYALAPINALAFSTRRALSWSQGAVTHANEPKNELFAYAGRRATGLGARERELRRRYRLDRLHGQSSAHVYRENLYVLDLLDRHVRDGELPAGDALRAIDVGSKDFRYAFGLARWLRHAGGSAGREVTLTGIELDGHPVWDDFHSRKDHAEAFAAEIDCARVDFQVKDFLAHEEQDVDVIFFCFPFVLEYALVRWGLPRRFFGPERLFRHAREMLRPGGLVFVMNHTHAERVRQLEILEASGFEIIRSEAATSSLVDYAADVLERSVTVARRRP
ncbi:MAG: hypothetical protein JWP97_6176 [Labilithrix sp.]|nr:hypothetical protein [Labilithrix sp.]